MYFCKCTLRQKFNFCHQKRKNHEFFLNILIFWKTSNDDLCFEKNCNFAPVCKWKGWFLILKSRKLKKFRISRFGGWWCFFFEVFCWFLRFWRKKGKITNKNYSTLANNVFLLFLLRYDAQKWWLGFDDEFDQKLFQVRFDVQKKNPGKRKGNEETCNQSESNFVNKEEKEITILRDELLDCVFLLTSEKGCFISRLILY